MKSKADEEHLMVNNQGDTARDGRPPATARGNLSLKCSMPVI